ncbi:MAG: hypothetical protein ACRD0P_22260, partial [Stackebrandtia sp.]
VKTLIDKCAKGVEEVSYDGGQCPWNDDDGFGGPFRAKWSIESYPKIKVTVTDEAVAEVETVEPGEATDKEEGQSVEITPQGTVSAEDGEVVWNSEDPNMP